MKGALNAAMALSILALPSGALSAVEKEEEYKARSIAASFAACVVRSNHKKAQDVVLALMNNSQIRQMAELLDGECLRLESGRRLQVRFQNDTFRYAIADALVGMEYASDGPRSFADRLPLAHFQPITPEDEARILARAEDTRARDAAQKGIDQQRALAWISRYGECVAREDPVNARFWLLTPPDTAEETGRINVMRPAFSVCLGEGTMRFNRILVRGEVAVSYYRLAKATAVPVAGSIQ